MKEHEVVPAFEMLLAEIEDVVNRLNQEGAQLLTAGKYEEARALIEKVEVINIIRDKVQSLSDDWRKLGLKTPQKPVDKKKPFQRKVTKFLKQGLRTPNEAFHTPILKALIDLGGTGRVKEVLDRVEELMSDQLNKYDYETLPSNPNELRWRNNAQWARWRLVQNGYLASDSPRGVWEITDAGRQFLEEQQLVKNQ